MSIRKRFTSPVFLISLFLLILAVLLFRAVWPADQVILSSDFNYGLMGQYKTELPNSFFKGFWRGSPLLGRAGYASPTWTFLSLSLLPLDFYMDWIYAINLLLASGFLIAFLRLKGVEWIPSLAGALTAYWLGSNLTLIYAGHLEKYGVLVFASATLYCLEQTLQKQSWRWALLAGGALGWMFMHQADVALFFGFVLGAYWVFGLIRNPRSPWPKRIALHLPLLAMALMFGWEMYSFSMKTQIHNVSVLQEAPPQEKWNFATQWSFPPNESLSLIAPGYWGWRSQHEKAPYHGRMGQSPEWEDQQKGYPNFKMESIYLGILSFSLALFAFWGSRARRPEVIFWSLALLVTFLLACGKYTPLYELFFKLPLVNSIRNPNKFLQVFQWILGILCALGMQTLFEAEIKISTRKKFALGLILISLLAGAASMRANGPEALFSFAKTPWTGQAAGILQTRQIALLHLSLMAGAGGGLIFASSTLRFRKIAMCGILLLFAFDGLRLSQEYLKPANTRFIKENKLADFLKENLGEQRVSVIDTSGLYNFYLTNLFPAHHIAFADIAVAPRLQNDYQEYFDAVGQNRIRIWQEFGVKYLLAPRNIYQQIMQNPGMDRVLREVYSYDLAGHPRGGLRIVPGKIGESGQHVVMEFLLPSERFSLLSKWDSADADDFLDAVKKRETPLQRARVQSGSTQGHVSAPAGEITGVLQTTSGFLIQARVDQSEAFLRISDHYNPDIRVRIDGGPEQSLLQTDLLFSGLVLPQGAHEIELLPPRLSAGILAQWMGLLIALGVVLSLGIRPTRS